MKRALVLQHVAHEGPARLQLALRAHDVQVEVCRLDQGAGVPDQVREFDLLVIMGGPMGVGDVDDPLHPFLRAELALLAQVVSSTQAVLGICLGAQLLAHALGARVYPNQLGEPPLRMREVGWGAMAFHHDADAGGLLAGLNDAEVMLHWHGDTFDLPVGADCLASTLQCPHQMFQSGRRVGLQFHPELDESDIEVLLRADADYVQGTLGPDGAARIRADTRRFFGRYRQVSEQLLRNLVRVLLDT